MKTIESFIQELEECGYSEISNGRVPNIYSYVSQEKNKFGITNHFHTERSMVSDEEIVGIAFHYKKNMWCFCYIFSSQKFLYWDEEKIAWEVIRDGNMTLPIVLALFLPHY